MRYKPEIYAKTLTEVLFEKKAGDAEIAKNFLKAVRKNGDWASLPKILRAVEERLVYARGGKLVLVESAGKLPDSYAAKFLEKFTKKDKIEFKLSPSLIAGVRLTLNGEQELDMSFKQKLRRLFS